MVIWNKNFITIKQIYNQISFQKFELATKFPFFISITIFSKSKLHLLFSFGRMHNQIPQIETASEKDNNSPVFL